MDRVDSVTAWTVPHWYRTKCANSAAVEHERKAGSNDYGRRQRTAWNESEYTPLIERVGVVVFQLLLLQRLAFTRDDTATTPSTTSTVSRV